MRIRQVQSGDAPLLTEGFTRLSAESRRLRFLTGKPSLTAAELRYLTELQESRGVRVTHRESGPVEYKITLPTRGLGDGLHSLLWAVGRAHQGDERG